jgi:signal peptide peptidase SppA
MEPSKMKRIHRFQNVQSILCEPLMLDARALPMLVDEARMEFGGKSSPVGMVEPEEPVVQITLYDGESMGVTELDTNGRAPGSLIAVVPLSGVVTRHGYSGWFSSAPGTLEIGRHLKALDNDESVGAIVMSINSPGGSVAGTPELSKLIYDIRKAGRTKMIACVDPMMASAATYIASACGTVYSIASGDVGSIGVISSYSDYSAYLERIGIKTEYFRIPAKKARFTGDEPLDDDMRQKLVEGITEAYEIFISDMARNRGVSEKHVREKFGQGEMMSATAGIEAGLIDGIASIDDVLSNLAIESQTKKRDYARKRAQERLESAKSMDVELTE